MLLLLVEELLPIPPNAMKELDVALAKRKHYLKPLFLDNVPTKRKLLLVVSLMLYNPADPDFQGRTCQKHLCKLQELLTVLENINEANKKYSLKKRKN